MTFSGVGAGRAADPAGWVGAAVTRSFTWDMREFLT